MDLFKIVKACPELSKDVNACPNTSPVHIYEKNVLAHLELYKTCLKKKTVEKFSCHSGIFSEK